LTFKSKIALFALVTAFFLTGCNYLLHPSKNYNYSERKLSNPSDKELSGFKVVRKELHFRQNGHLTYDYFRFSRPIQLPEDTAGFKTMVNEILLTRLNNLKIDSITFESVVFNKNDLSRAEGKEYIIALGNVWSKKKGKVRSRRLEAICLPKVHPSIVQIGTYYSLGF